MVRDYVIGRMTVDGMALDFDVGSDHRSVGWCRGGMGNGCATSRYDSVSQDVL